MRTSIAAFVLTAFVTQIAPSHGQEPFCDAVPIDDAIRYQGKLRIFSGDLFWDIDSSSLPLTTPLKKDGKRIQHMESHIDAASETGEGNEFLYFKKGTVYFMKDENRLDKKMPIVEFVFGSKDHNPIDVINAAWFNPKTRHLFLFHGTHYYEMEKKSDGQWSIIRPSDRLLVQDLKINVPKVDAAFTVGNSLILTRDKWFFALPTTGFLFPGVAYAANLALGTETVGLFDTRRSCHMDRSAYSDLLQRMEFEDGLEDKEELGFKAMQDRDGEGVQPKSVNTTAKPKKREDPVIWPYIVVAVLIAVLLAVAVYCIWVRQRKSTIKSNEVS